MKHPLPPIFAEWVAKVLGELNPSNLVTWSELSEWLQEAAPRLGLLLKVAALLLKCLNKLKMAGFLRKMLSNLKAWVGHLWISRKRSADSSTSPQPAQISTSKPSVRVKASTAPFPGIPSPGFLNYAEDMQRAADRVNREMSSNVYLNEYRRAEAAANEFNRLISRGQLAEIQRIQAAMPTIEALRRTGLL